MECLNIKLLSIHKYADTPIFKTCYRASAEKNDLYEERLT